MTSNAGNMPILDSAAARAVPAPDGSPWVANDIIVNCPIIVQL